MRPDNYNFDTKIYKNIMRKENYRIISLTAIYTNNIYICKLISAICKTMIPNAQVKVILKMGKMTEHLKLNECNSQNIKEKII